MGAWVSQSVCVRVCVPRCPLITVLMLAMRLAKNSPPLSSKSRFHFAPLRPTPPPALAHLLPAPGHQRVRDVCERHAQQSDAKGHQHAELARHAGQHVARTVVPRARKYRVSVGKYTTSVLVCMNTCIPCAHVNTCTQISMAISSTSAVSCGNRAQNRGSRAYSKSDIHMQ